MPLDPNLDVNFSGQDAAIEAALKTALNILTTVISKPLNLSVKERQFTPSIGEHRETYVANSITALGAQFPNMLGPEITLPRAQNLWNYRNQSRPLIPIAEAILDLLIDSNINAENLCLKFTEDMRLKAKRFKDRNVPGADVVWDHLKDLHKHEDVNPLVP